MDAVKFLKELRRLCKFDKSGWCDECPMKDCCLSEEAPLFWKDEIIALAIPIVEKWSAEHPQKTRLQDFLEKFPDAPLYEDDEGKFPMLCPSVLGYCGNESSYPCGKCPYDEEPETLCWNLPLEG